MSIEKTLNLVPVKKPNERNPVVCRRERLIKSLNRQLELVKKHRIGEKTTRLWFWSDDEGNYFLPIKYGKLVLELGKGKHSIQCSSLDDVENSLESVKTFATKGELDQILTKASQEIRRKFKK
jgi:hypothetical protein